MMQLQDFYDLHKGQTCLLVGNGINLKLTPPELFALPSFGMNTCHRWQGTWVPTYYCAVDKRVMREFGDEILDRFSDIPKFIPRPNLDSWQGPNFYRFLHRPGGLMESGYSPSSPKALTTDGIGYYNIMHVAIQLAWHMGFSKMIMVGVQHKPFKAQVHFWGTDHGMPANHFQEWMDGYKYLAGQVNLVNVSEDTYVPENIIPRENWENYVKDRAGLRFI